ncbi:MAG: YraN family protein [Ruminococcus sp.]
MSLFSSVAKGNAGEDYTAKYLNKKGYKIIARNMRNRISEIDIIAENKDYIIFVEVKTRSNETYITPSMSVDRKKQKKIIASAHRYLADNKCLKQPRFDVAEVFIDAESLKLKKINYIESAYIQGGNYAVF